MAKQAAMEMEPWDAPNTAVALNDMFDLKENMAGVEARLPQIKIIHQAQMFEMPDGEKEKTISGVILDISRANAYWEVSFDTTGGGTPPDCASLDGVKPDPFSGQIQSQTCASCPKNQFGSDGGRGKACKNLKRLHILMDGDLLPSRLTIPPSNLKPIDMYVTILTGKGTPYQLVVTEMSLKKVQNKDGIAYSELVLRSLSKIEDRDAALRIKAMRAEFLGVMRGQTITAEEV